MKKKNNLNEKINLILELKRSGVSDLKILNVIEKTDRGLFIDTTLSKKSHLNVALPIDCGQTISQPLVVALMTQALDVNDKMRVLEIGTGSGYQTHILSQLFRFVYTIERYKSLVIKAEKLFKKLENSNVFCRHGDGGLGWVEQAPFDRIIVTASAPEIPKNLLDQLEVGGIMIIPVGEDFNDQILKKVVKNNNNRISVTNILDVRFVPLLEGKESR